MQTLTSCMQCQSETGHPNFQSHMAVDIPESGVIDTTCDQGHQTFTVIQEAKFEILSAMAVTSLAGGAYRDSVSSFAASLERLHEFFVAAMARKRGIGAMSFAAAWKPMANSSERQLGAFLTAFLIETGAAPIMLPDRQISFRNAVIHKGRLASRDEAHAFGKAVFACALPVLSVLRAKQFASTIHAITTERVRERSAPAREAGAIVSTQSMATPLSFVLADQPSDFDAIVESYAARPTIDQIIASAHLFGGRAQRT